MFKIGDLVEVVKGDYYSKIGIRLKIFRIENHGLVGKTILFDDNSESFGVYAEQVIKIESEDNKMTKNFKEVIADIKEGEVWESKELLVFIDSEEKEIVLRNKTERFNCKEIGIQDVAVFTLQRQKVSFTKAFKAYEEGKEIESCITSNKWSKDSVNFASFLIEEIRGQWYINN